MCLICLWWSENMQQSHRTPLRILHLLHRSSLAKPSEQTKYHQGQLASGPKPNYTALMSDLETRGFLPNLDTLEISSLSHFEKEVTTLHATLPNLTRTISCILLELSKIAIYCKKNYTTKHALTTQEKLHNQACLHDHR